MVVDKTMCRCFLFAPCDVTVRRPNLEVATKRLLHRQVKIPLWFLCHTAPESLFLTAISGGLDS